MTDSPETEWSGRNLEKDALRTEVWIQLKQQQAAIRDPFGHIPNFVGADRAAEQLVTLPI